MIPIVLRPKMCTLVILACVVLARNVASQQIWDIWQTTWNRGHLFSDISPTTPINFTSPNVIGQADITVDDSSTFQSVWGFGGSLTDSSALVLNNMKSTDATNYWELLHYMFDTTDGANAAGLSYIRIPLGASDFSSKLYSYDDHDGDTALTKFTIDAAPSYLFSVIKDIMSVNSVLKVHVLPWSPPGWMKSGGTMDGGNLTTGLVNTYANYLLKSLQGFQSKGIPVYAISIQNEPENVNPTYPTCSMPVSIHAQIGIILRTLMDNNGFSGTKLIGYEHNWNDAAVYPVQLMDQAESAFDGVAFHCYEGTVDEMDNFHTKYPTKEIYITECAGVIGSDWWSDIKWYMDNLFTVGITHNSASGLMWNIAGQPDGGPKLPGTSSCGGSGCRPIATVNSDGTYDVNQEFYSMAQASKAIIPKDSGGPWGQRIGVSVGGTLNWALVVGAYVTGRVHASDWNRYSLVVLNWYDNSTGSWDPQPVQTTIEFRDMQATYTFPVGMTTLWWFAVADSFDGGNTFDSQIYGESNGQQIPMRLFE